MRHRRGEEWLKKGVVIADDVNPESIAADARIYPGCRIRGRDTSIGPGCIIGAEAPATIENCQLGRHVELKGGFYAGAVFLEGANTGIGAHIRSGTVLRSRRAPHMPWD